MANRLSVQTKKEIIYLLNLVFVLPLVGWSFCPSWLLFFCFEDVDDNVLKRAVKNNSFFDIKGFVDDDESKENKIIDGIIVYKMNINLMSKITCNLPLLF